MACGCGSKGSSVPAPKRGQTLKIAAPWPAGGQIPRRYTCDGAGVTPTLAGIPAGASAVVMSDPDAPGGTFIHWTHWDAGVEGRNSLGHVGYSGPCPPKGDKPHHYVITVYALRHKLGLPSGAPAGTVLAAIGPNTVAKGSITGTYRR